MMEIKHRFSGKVLFKSEKKPELVKEEVTRYYDGRY